MNYQAAGSYNFQIDTGSSNHLVEHKMPDLLFSYHQNVLRFFYMFTGMIVDYLDEICQILIIDFMVFFRNIHFLRLFISFINPNFLGIFLLCLNDFFMNSLLKKGSIRSNLFYRNTKIDKENFQWPLSRKDDFNGEEEYCAHYSLVPVTFRSLILAK
jgi:hypothetical protein